MHNYNESWRRHIDKHTIDLRNAQSSKTAQPVDDERIIDLSSQQTQERVMRNFAAMTPEELASTEVEDQGNLSEYNEALRRSLHEQQQTTHTSSTVHTANFDSYPDIQTEQDVDEDTDAENDVGVDRHSLLRELNAELASIEYAPDVPNLKPLPQSKSPFLFIPFSQDQPAEEDEPEEDEPEEYDDSEPAKEDEFVAQETPIAQDTATMPQKNESVLRDPEKLHHNLSTLAYGPPIDGGEIASALHIKARKSFLKKITAALAIIIVAVVLVGVGFLGGKFINVKAYAGENAQQGYEYMESGKEALLVLDASTAHANFQKAYESFQDIEDTLGFFSKTALSLADIVPFENNIPSSVRLLDAGKLYAQAGIEASLALSQAQHLQNAEVSLNASVRSNNVQTIVQHFDAAQQNFLKANTLIASVHPDNIPAEFQEQFQTLQSQAFSIEQVLDQVDVFLPAVLDVLGYNQEKRYLFMFQNHSELRATGGFLGTYGTVVVRNGQLEDLFVNGIYDPDGQLRERIVPPKPLQHITPNWGTRDANWFFDFPSSAQKTARFFEMSGQGNVDGVIAMNPRIVQQLLRVVGDVEMSEYGVTITADNFLEVVQQEVEVDYNRQLNKPKQILADMAPILIERVMEQDDKIEIGNIFFEGLLQKHIMLYSTNPESQALLEQQGWSGAVQHKQSTPNTIHDYLAVVVSNIGGGKTDIYTDSFLDSTTTVKHNGSIERTIWFSREHKGGDTPYSWYNSVNDGYIRFYVPLGAEIIEAGGFSEEPEYIDTDYVGEGYIIDSDLGRLEAQQTKHAESNTDIYTESNKTVFGNWMSVRPGTKQLAYITYRLPISLSEKVRHYNLTLQKQSGLEVEYSGILNIDPDNVIVGDCSLNHESIPVSKFTFTQTQDSIFACDIVQRQL